MVGSSSSDAKDKVTMVGATIEEKCSGSNMQPTSTPAVERLCNMLLDDATSFSGALL